MQKKILIVLKRNITLVLSRPYFVVLVPFLWVICANSRHVWCRRNAYQHSAALGTVCQAVVVSAGIRQECYGHWTVSNASLLPCASHDETLCSLTSKCLYYNGKKTERLVSRFLLPSLASLNLIWQRAQSIGSTRNVILRIMCSCTKLLHT
jgi:hypothetical protein